MFKANQLIKDINKKLDNWDERSQFKIKGVGNLSRSDLDSCILYAETYMRIGGISGLITPRGDLKVILEAYGLEIVDNFGW